MNVIKLIKKKIQYEYNAMFVYTPVVNLSKNKIHIILSFPFII